MDNVLASIASWLSAGASWISAAIALLALIVAVAGWRAALRSARAAERSAEAGAKSAEAGAKSAEAGVRSAEQATRSAAAAERSVEVLEEHARIRQAAQAWGMVPETITSVGPKGECPLGARNRGERLREVVFAPEGGESIGPFDVSPEVKGVYDAGVVPWPGDGNEVRLVVTGETAEGWGFLVEWFFVGRQTPRNGKWLQLSRRGMTELTPPEVRIVKRRTGRDVILGTPPPLQAFFGGGSSGDPV